MDSTAGVGGVVVLLSVTVLVLLGVIAALVFGGGDDTLTDECREFIRAGINLPQRCL